MTTAELQTSSLSLDDVQHFVLDYANWELYQKLLKAVGNRQIRITYDQGTLEIMSPLPEHESPKVIISRLIEMLTLECGIDLASYGSSTFKLPEEEKGLEPDECYYIQHARQMRARKRINLKKDPAPDLVVEIDITIRSVAREPIYAAMGVPEMWRWDGRQLQCLHLVAGNYRVRKFSLAFNFLEPAKLTRFVEMKDRLGETATIKAFVRWMRSMNWSAE